MSEYHVWIELAGLVVAILMLWLTIRGESKKGRESVFASINQVSANIGVVKTDLSSQIAASREASRLRTDELRTSIEDRIETTIDKIGRTYVRQDVHASDMRLVQQAAEEAQATANSAAAVAERAAERAAGRRAEAARARAKSRTAKSE